MPAHSDDGCTDVQALQQTRRDWYAAAEPGAVDQVPNPAYAVPGQEGGPRRPDNDAPAYGCLIVLVLAVVTVSLASSFWRDGRTALGWTMLGLALVVGLVVVRLLAFMGTRFVEVSLERRWARPWADFAAAVDDADRDHFDMSWSVFAAHEEEMRRAVIALGRGHDVPGAERARLERRVDELGAEAFALRASAERITRQLAEQTGDTGVRRRPVDSLPAFDPDELAVAAQATETAVSAGLAPIEGREDDVDFASLVSQRRRHYDAAGVNPVSVPNPRWPLLGARRTATRRRVHGARSCLATGLALLALIAFCVMAVTAFTGPVLACAGAGTATILAVGLFALTTPAEPDLPTVSAPAWMAEPWVDVVQAVRFAASGRAGVSTALALDAAEPRVRSALTLVLEDHQVRSAPASGATGPAALGQLDLAELREECHDLCARVWALHRIEGLAEQQLQAAADAGGA